MDWRILACEWCLIFFSRARGLNKRYPYSWLAFERGIGTFEIPRESFGIRLAQGLLALAYGHCVRATNTGLLDEDMTLASRLALWVWHTSWLWTFSSVYGSTL